MVSKAFIGLQKLKAIAGTLTAPLRVFWMAAAGERTLCRRGKAAWM